MKIPQFKQTTWFGIIFISLLCSVLCGVNGSFIGYMLFTGLTCWLLFMSIFLIEIPPTRK